LVDLVVARPEGLYCLPGDFYIDAWRPVAHTILTHAHADHARPGHGRYLVARPGIPLLRNRLGEIAVDALEYGERIMRNGVAISLHSAGHVLGSAQVRLEYRGEVWVVSGDYKLEADSTCSPFETLRCHTFITESTFGLPIYRWQPQAAVFAQINDWWRRNAEQNRASVLYCYALGKAQRVLAGIDPDIGPIVCHGAVEKVNAAYREANIPLPVTRMATEMSKTELRRALVLAPPSAMKSPWLKRFGDYSDGYASGWMLLRGARRRRAVDRGFVLSDHADWPALMQAIEATGAPRVIVTHGQIPAMVRWLEQHGFGAGTFATEFGTEEMPAAEETGGAVDA
jgi:putative mRNA 3-end processing factor